mmetsp:Transcript_118425/g.334796  ORF Transcript_118425/g.334796 Transcript_118425/m.334796 type:complete len:231 (-) Transcript_118425:200-892(-)
MNSVVLCFWLFAIALWSMASSCSSSSRTRARRLAWRELQSREPSCLSKDVSVRYSWPLGDVPRCVIIFLRSSTRFSSFAFCSFGSFGEVSASSAATAWACLASNSDNRCVVSRAYAVRSLGKLLSKSSTKRLIKLVGISLAVSSAAVKSMLHHCLHRSVSACVAPGRAARSKTLTTTEVAMSSMSMDRTNWSWSSLSRRLISVQFNAYSKSSHPGLESSRHSTAARPSSS